MQRSNSKSPIREFRRKLGINQLNFWQHVGVTQSGGSRYESGRSIPKPVGILLKLVYGSEMGSAKMLAALRARAKR